MADRMARFEYLHETGDQIPRVVNDIRRGRLDCTGTVDVPAGATSIAISSYGFGPNTVAWLVPLTAAAAGAAWWLASAEKGRIIFGCASAPARSYAWVALG